MTDDTAPVLGRYGALHLEEPLVEVRLLNFPLQLFESARQHHDDLMREFALLAMRPPAAGTVPHRLLELIELLGHRYGAAGERSDAVRDAAIERGDDSIDLTYHLPRSAMPELRNLHELMEEADEYCRSEQMLTLASTPAERRFRVWFIEQFVTQLDGAEPVPYDGPMADAQPGA
jgi:hypothetical protein